MLRLLTVLLLLLTVAPAFADPAAEGHAHAEAHAAPAEHPEPAHVASASSGPAAAQPSDLIRAIPAPAVATTATLAAPAAVAPRKIEPFNSPYRLKGVRVQSQDSGLRVIFVFDQIAAYNLRITPGSKVAELELIGTEVGYLAPELVQLNRPELSGLWLTRATEALSVLELRLPSDKVRIDHFTIPDMGVLVLDLQRTEPNASVRVGQQSVVSSTEAQPGVLPLNVMLARTGKSETETAASSPTQGIDLTPVSPAMLTESPPPQARRHRSTLRRSKVRIPAPRTPQALPRLRSPFRSRRMPARAARSAPSTRTTIISPSARSLPIHRWARRSSRPSSSRTGKASWIRPCANISNATRWGARRST